MSGQIHRFKKERDFVNLDTHALRNPALSWKAKGLHSYLLQLPDNWQINIADLASRSKDGRDGTAAGMTELVDAGYVIRKRVLNEKKQFEGWDYNVFEQPKQADEWKAENGKSVNGFAENGKSVTNKVLSISKNEERGDNEKNSLSPGYNSVSFEAEKEKKNPPVAPAPPYSGPTLVEIHDATHPGIPVFDIIAPVTEPPKNSIKLTDRPNAETPVQLESALRDFYTAWPNEWSVGILENGRGRKYDAPKQTEIVKDFCCWAISQNRQRDTFRELNARLQGWFRNEQHSTWKQAKPGQPEPPKNPNSKPFQYRQL